MTPSTEDADDRTPPIPWWRPDFSWKGWLLLVAIFFFVWFASKPFSARNQLHASATSHPTLWQIFDFAPYDDELPLRR